MKEVTSTKYKVPSIKYKVPRKKEEEKINF
jgi:hypothetical protein